MQQNEASFFINSGFPASRTNTHTENMQEHCSLSPLVLSKDVFRKLTDSCRRDGETEAQVHSAHTLMFACSSGGYTTLSVIPKRQVFSE